MSRKLTTEEFIEQASIVHGDLYDYTNVVYVGSRTKVEIICKTHGSFFQSPTKHVRAGQGCNLCGNRKIGNKLSGTTEEFVAVSTSVHGNRYDYSRVEYKNSKNELEIICKEHGPFWQLPHVHTAGSGCPKCSPNRFRYTKKEVIERGQKIHNGEYTYLIDKECKLTKETKLKIVCKKHGLFRQRLDNHLKQGSGCPECYKEKAGVGFYWSPVSAYGILGYYGTLSPSNIYILKINNSFIKVGLSKDMPSRMYTIAKESGYSVEKIISVPGRAYCLWLLEQTILRHSNLKRHCPDTPFAGQSECLELSELPKVLEIIQEWVDNRSEDCYIEYDQTEKES